MTVRSNITCLSGYVSNYRSFLNIFFLVQNHYKVYPNLLENMGEICKSLFRSLEIEKLESEIGNKEID